jgi:4-carboxymuconolactone decarboxylase
MKSRTTAQPRAAQSVVNAARKSRNHQSPAFQAGLGMRSQVLGPDYVQRAFETADDLSQPFQELATEFAWGSVWTREGLTLRERSLMTLAMCIAMNRPRELQIHLRGALRNGVERELLPEILLHAFLYCGGPACIDAMHAMREVLPALEKELQASKPRKAAAAKKPATKRASSSKKTTSPQRAGASKAKASRRP